MTIKKSITILGFIIFLIGVWLVGFATPVGAETMKIRLHSLATKVERVFIGDVEGHTLGLTVRRGILEFENGENGTHISVISSDTIKGTGSVLSYSTITFADGSAIIAKSQSTLGGGTAVGAHTWSEGTGEIIKGTGRFEGIKGTQTTRMKYFPLEKGEDGPKAIGEITINYTLPSK